MRLDPAASDNLLTYGMSHWSFVGVTVFVMIEPRGVPWGDDDDPLDFVFDFGEFPVSGVGFTWNKDTRTLYSPTKHGGEIRWSDAPRKNRKYVVAIQYKFGTGGYVRALTQFTTMHGWADLVEITGQNFSVPGFTPDTITHEQNPFSIGCMSRKTLLIRQKGSVCSGVISQSSDTTPICFQMIRYLPFATSLSINTCLNASHGNVQA